MPEPHLYAERADGEAEKSQEDASFDVRRDWIDHRRVIDDEDDNH